LPVRIPAATPVLCLKVGSLHRLLWFDVKTAQQLVRLIPRLNVYVLRTHT
jgi:hypothetical protein